MGEAVCVHSNLYHPVIPGKWAECLRTCARVRDEYMSEYEPLPSPSRHATMLAI